MAISLKIIIGVTTCLTLLSCGKTADSNKSNATPKENVEQFNQKTENFQARTGDCRFSNETASTSLDEHLKNIKQALGGSALSKYYIPCGSFIAGERYYDDMLTPAAHETIEEIRSIKKFKELSVQALLSTKSDSPKYRDLITVNGNWKNDSRVASVLIRLLTNKDHEIRHEAAGALKGVTSTGAIANLIRMTKSPKALDRFMAALALEGTQDHSARRALLDLSSDEDLSVRTQAIFSST